MTVNELIEVLKKFDGNLEVVNAIPATAIDRDAYGEDIDIYSIFDDDFEIDAEHNALVFKSCDECTPSYRDWKFNDYRCN